MTKSINLSANDLECLEIGRNVKLAGMRLAIGVLREQMEFLERQAHPPAVNGTIKPAMLRTLERAGIELPQLPAPAKAKRTKAAKGYWAKMTRAERSAEMRRRQAVAAGTESARPRVKLAQSGQPRKLVQPNHPRNTGHPKHEEWLAKTRRANRKSWASMTPEARKARIAAAQAGRGLKPKS
jgi:hypothetical protein